MKQILVLGAGFAGLWCAVGAQRKLRELGHQRDATVTVVNREPFHNIRVRNYEPDLSDVCIPLADVFEPIGVETVIGEVVEIDTARRRVSVRADAAPSDLAYDALVLALGSELVRPPVPGLAAFGFDVDTYRAAHALDSHLRGLPATRLPGRSTVIVAGAGLTGIEVATEMPERLAHIFGSGLPPKVILVDRQPHVGSDMGEAARPVIESALARLKVETRTGVAITNIERDRVTLSSGEAIECATVVWCAGMRANPLLSKLGLPVDRLGRIAVDEFMRSASIENVFAAGDVARAQIDPAHGSVMSCQYGRPMGRYAGHNVVAYLYDRPMLPLTVDWYVTVLDLGPAGALYTKGFDRQVFATGASAKETKRTINRQRIYPPRNRNPDDILAAAAPIVQAPPVVEQRQV